MKIAYFDCLAGIAGDMILGALVEAGVPVKYLQDVMSRLPFKNYTLIAQKVGRAGLAATRVGLALKKAGAVGAKNGSRFLSFDQKTNLAPRGGGYPWTKIDAILKRSRLPQKIRESSRRIFRRLAAAEAKVHGRRLDQVHFHELATVDAVYEVVGAVAGLAYLKVKKIFSSPLPLGGGWIKTSHGRLPVPAPATAHLLKGVPTYQDGRAGELVTPTGAAIITALAEVFGPMPEARYARIGLGAGGRDDKDRPNVLRVFIGETSPAGIKPDDQTEDTAIMVETNIDDLNPQIYEYLIEQLLALGAYDVFLTPVIMKKSRPGILLSVLTGVDKLPEITSKIFSETSTFGLRTYPVQRQKQERRIKTVRTKYGPVKVKLGYWQGRLVNCSPEYEDCRRLAAAKKVPLKTIYRQAQEIAWSGLS